MENTFLTLLVIAGVVGVIILLSKAISSPHQSKDPEWKRQIKNRLVSLEEARNETNPHIQRQIVVEMDKALDFVLINKKFKGETMGERLKSAKNKLSREQYNMAWEAHKERNRLVHEMEYHLSSHTYRQVNSSFSQVIRQLIK